MALALMTGLAVGDCGAVFPTENSFSGDAATYKPIFGSKQFLAANEIIVQRCAACHSDFSGYSEQEWIHKPGRGRIAGGVQAD